jgi:hypothetical protein
MEHKQMPGRAPGTRTIDAGVETLQRVIVWLAAAYLPATLAVV